MFFGGRKDPPEQEGKEDKKDQQGDHGIGGYPINTLHVVFDEF
jgi:hypothetical protein